MKTDPEHVAWTCAVCGAVSETSLGSAEPSADEVTQRARVSGAGPWRHSVLVVANVTAGSDELFAALLERAQRGPTAFTLLLPPRLGGPYARAQAHQRLSAALERFRGAGLQIDGQIGDCDPVVAVSELFDARQHDEIIVSTLPSEASRWLAADLPARIRRLTDVPVRQVVATPRPAAVRSVVVPPRPKTGVLSPLRALAWSAPHEHRRARSRPPAGSPLARRRSRDR